MRTTEKKMPAGAPPKGPGGKRKIDFRQLSRVIKLMFRYYPKMIPVAIVCIVFSAITAAIPAIFLEQVTNAIQTCLENGTTWAEASRIIVPKVLVLICF